MCRGARMHRCGQGKDEKIKWHARKAEVSPAASAGRAASEKQKKWGAAKPQRRNASVATRCGVTFDPLDTSEYVLVGIR